jgi:hypothetical protein
MIIKIDMENAFDRVRHNFLLVVLTRFGFGVETLPGFHPASMNP